MSKEMYKWEIRFEWFGYEKPTPAFVENLAQQMQKVSLPPDTGVWYWIEKIN